MSRTGWLVNKTGFEKVVILEESERHRKVEFAEGPRAGQSIVISPAGEPWRGFNPALYEGEEPPKVWRLRNRSLPIARPEDFTNPEQAKALIPKRNRTLSCRTPRR